MATYPVYAPVFPGIIVWKERTFETFLLSFLSKGHETIASQNITVSPWAQLLKNNIAATVTAIRLCMLNTENKSLKKEFSCTDRWQEKKTQTDKVTECV